MKINYVLESIFIVQKKIKNSEDGKISDGHVSIEDYMVCERIWDKFKMKNIGDYHDHYLKKDVLLLAYIFEKFIDTCLRYYGLDHCHYFSAPGLSWDKMLKMTGAKLQYLFIEKALRGRISYIAKRYAKVNNKYMSDYDSNKQATFITYLDKNNLYGWAMSVGYVLEVDLKYPDELHELHNDYPLAPETLTVTNDMFSNYCKSIADKYEKNDGDVKKIIPNLGNKNM